MDIESIVKRQREFFATGATLPVSARVDALKRLQANIRAAEKDLQAAMKQDLNKCGFESYMAEIGMVLDEVGHAIKKLPGWAKPKRARTPMSQFSAKSFTLSEPYGVTLVMAPWNYPFLLSMDPVVGAVAAGNCVVLKPSAYAPATSAAMAKLIADTFDPGWVTVVEGGRKENSALLDQRFDFIFFTGGVTVGKLVMEKASHWLTPVILELGGKSPVLIDRTADIPLTAKRLAFGKVLNAGQTCVAPDYVLVDRTVKDRLVEELKKQFAAMLGPDPLHNPDYVRIINRKHFERVTGLLEGETILAGGKSRADEVSGWIEPTLVEGTADCKPMQEEIFGPILPLIPVESMDEAIAFVNGREKPLALYLFTKDPAVEQKVLARCSFGGGCVNDTIIHLATHDMGFGGVGQSGMGNYHGKRSFDTFSHEKSIVKKALWLDLPMRYMPYTKKNEKMVRMFLK